MQTALGVAGGFLIADAISGMLSADGAAAGASEAAPADDPALAEEDRLGGEDPGPWEEATGSDFDFDEL